jgi:hypothetical protein
MEIKKIDLNSGDVASPVANRPVSSSPTPKKTKSFAPLFIILAIILGVSSGAILKNLKSGSASLLGGSSNGVKTPGETSSIKPGEVFGAKDESDFPDEAIGILEEGGLDGEGTHKLLRSGGESKTAYLTSSVLDMDQFVGFKITVWGETFSAQKAGWLMDVGRVKVEELEPTPLE